MRLLPLVRGKLLAYAFPVLFRVDVKRADMVRLGSPYGGWWVPSGLLDSRSICYSGGIGTDISFDAALIESFGCRVVGIDPTPRSLAWMAEQPSDPRFTVVPVGLAGSPGELQFFAPRQEGHVSYSTKNLQGTSEYVTAEVRTVRQLMIDLGHDRLDLLKLDIEGAEHETLERALADGVRPRVVCVEYDQPEPLAWGLRTTRALRAAGYLLAKVEGFNLTFVHRTA